MMSTIKVYVVRATDNDGKLVERAKFFAPSPAYDHVDHIKLNASQGWRGVEVIERDELVEDQHAAHQAVARPALKQVMYSPASKSTPPLPSQKP